MKLFPLLLLLAVTAKSQNIQLHYDFRHYPTLYFEYWKKQDSGHALIKPGSTLLKSEASFLGARNNIGKYYLQISQSFRLWQPQIFLALQYSGGGGITEPKQYSYYIANTFSAGAEYPFQWKGAYFTTQLYYRWSLGYPKPGHDFLYTLYWWKGLFHYKLELAGDFSIWTEDKDHDPSPKEHGKRFFFFAEPQAWLNCTSRLAIGSKLNMYYHVNTPAPTLQLAPTAALRVKL
ncbi:MAG: DUF5020 family protein [Bacteroidetes bacterium]|nr:DUF5020 family protein [Bacteroidota bacterium]